MSIFKIRFLDLASLFITELFKIFHVLENMKFRMDNKASDAQMHNLMYFKTVSDQVLNSTMKIFSIESNNESHLLKLKTKALSHFLR